MRTNNSHISFSMTQVSWLGFKPVSWHAWLGFEPTPWWLCHKSVNLCQGKLKNTVQNLECCAFSSPFFLLFSRPVKGHVWISKLVFFLFLHMWCVIYYVVFVSMHYACYSSYHLSVWFPVLLGVWKNMIFSRKVCWSLGLHLVVFTHCFISPWKKNKLENHVYVS